MPRSGWPSSSATRIGDTSQEVFCRESTLKAPKRSKLRRRPETASLGGCTVLCHEKRAPLGNLLARTARAGRARARGPNRTGERAPPGWAGRARGWAGMNAPAHPPARARPRKPDPGQTQRQLQSRPMWSLRAGHRAQAGTRANGGSERPEPMRWIGSFPSSRARLSLKAMGWSRLKGPPKSASAGQRGMSMPTGPRSPGSVPTSDLECSTPAFFQVPGAGLVAPAREPRAPMQSPPLKRGAPASAARLTQRSRRRLYRRGAGVRFWL